MKTELEVLVQKHLADSEELVWVGQPDPEQYAGNGIGCCLGITVVLALPVLFMLQDGLQALEYMWLPIFLAVATILLKIFKQKGAEYIIYAITSQRLLIIDATSSNSIESYPFADVSEVKVYARDDRIGDIIFAKRVSVNPDGKGGEIVTNIGFEFVPRAQEVAAKIHQRVYGIQPNKDL
ncbi:MAG: hypothetical protein R3A44_19120 [Caldilineaceae bacterium]